MIFFQMGLQMVIAIRQFDIDRGQDVNMRVGIHTGKVMYSIYFLLAMPRAMPIKTIITSLSGHVWNGGNAKIQVRCVLQ